MRMWLRFLAFVACFFAAAGALTILLVGAAACGKPQVAALAPVVVFGVYTLFARTYRSRTEDDGARASR